MKQSQKSDSLFLEEFDVIRAALEKIRHGVDHNLSSNTRLNKVLDDLKRSSRENDNLRHQIQLVREECDILREECNEWKRKTEQSDLREQKRSKELRKMKSFLRQMLSDMSLSQSQGNKDDLAELFDTTVPSRRASVRRSVELFLEECKSPNTGSKAKQWPQSDIADSPEVIVVATHSGYRQATEEQHNRRQTEEQEPSEEDSYPFVPPSSYPDNRRVPSQQRTFSFVQRSPNALNDTQRNQFSQLCDRQSGVSRTPSPTNTLQTISSQLASLLEAPSSPKQYFPTTPEGNVSTLPKPSTPPEPFPSQEVTNLLSPPKSQSIRLPSLGYIDEADESDQLVITTPLDQISAKMINRRRSVASVTTPPRSPYRSCMLDPGNQLCQWDAVFSNQRGTISEKKTNDETISKENHVLRTSPKISQALSQGAVIEDLRGCPECIKWFTAVGGALSTDFTCTHKRATNPLTSSRHKKRRPQSEDTKQKAKKKKSIGTSPKGFWDFDI